jgi:murein DD-endopeptidase MepM/ murein hydrolase activator NlpD
VAIGGGPTLNGALTTAASVGRRAARTLAGDFRDRVVGAAFANLKLSMGLLLTGTGLLLAVVAAPVLIVVFAMSVGVSHGLALDEPLVIDPGPPLAANELACPLAGSTVTQSFGPSELPGEPVMFGFPHFHTGIDLAMPVGTPIRAAEPGQVIDAAGQTDSLGMLVGYGNLVRVQAASGRVDYYGHMSDFAVSRGDVVQAGQVLGYVGSTGYSTGPHLHFEVRINGTPVNPALFLRPC